jgi:cell division protein FtsB
MTIMRLIHLKQSLLALGLSFLIASGVHPAEVKDSMQVVTVTNSSASASQQKIDGLAQDTRKLLEEYRKLLDGSEYQAAYTRELEDLQQAQGERIARLREQIEQARITRQRIVPLMRSMADALEKFVLLDMPFHQQERVAAVLDLKQRLRQPELSVPAKFRTLLEAYQVEQDYGGTIESWRGPLRSGAESLSVEFLRVGRVALYYQALDGSSAGYWSSRDQSWQPLDSIYSRNLTQALRVAQNLLAPQLLDLPVPVPGRESDTAAEAGI